MSVSGTLPNRRIPALPAPHEAVASGVHAIDRSASANQLDSVAPRHACAARVPVALHFQLQAASVEASQRHALELASRCASLSRFPREPPDGARSPALAMASA